MFGIDDEEAADDVSVEEQKLLKLLAELQTWSEEDNQALDDMLLRLAPSFFAEDSTMNRLPIERLFKLAIAEGKEYLPTIAGAFAHITERGRENAKRKIGERWKAAWEKHKGMVQERLDRLRARAQAERVVPREEG